MVFFFFQENLLFALLRIYDATKIEMKLLRLKSNEMRNSKCLQHAFTVELSSFAKMLSKIKKTLCFAHCKQRRRDPCRTLSGKETPLNIHRDPGERALVWRK